MADGLCIGDAVSNVIEKTIVKDYGDVIECENIDRVNAVSCKKVSSFYMESDSDKLFDKLCANNKGSKHEGFLDMEMPPCSPSEDDCRKKRCVDRYDSSESSDSGVAVLSCTDCSGSSTASSDITDPGSPFSTASSHSEDSGSPSQPAKMPPTQNAHHSPWPWTLDESPPLKRPTQEKTVFSKRLKMEKDANNSKQSPTCLSNLNNTQTGNISSVNKSQVMPKQRDAIEGPSLIDKLVKSNKLMKKQQEELSPKMQQGKITEYFKSQMKSNGIKKELSNLALKTSDLRNSNKLISLVDGKQLMNGIIKQQSLRKTMDVRTTNPVVKKVAADSKVRKLSPVSVPRKILPAPSKVPEKITISNHVNNITNFTPTVTLTAVSFPPNLTYLHTKAPKPPDNIFVPQLNAIPIVNRTQCLNVIQPIQKITTINNFNCVKLNATVLPIVKLNTMPPSRSNGSNNVTLSVETAVPTVLSAKPKIVNECSINTTNIAVTNLTPKQCSTPASSSNSVIDNIGKSRTEETKTSSSSASSSSSSTSSSTSSSSSPLDSDSGVSSKDNLEISVSQTVTVEPQKSPILSQPKTIRFPAKQQENTEKETRSHSNDSGLCRWAECHAQFDTSGALLEHLQVKHVISQATQEQYVCLWLGCKVHGRTSCSRTWLERHVLAHAGTKPFRCIVDGCGMRFNSQLALERHVNNHFNSEGSQNGGSKKSVENGSVKLYKRNGKRIRYRRQPWSARMFDFIDSGIMEGLQHRLLTMTEKRTLGQFENTSGDTVTLQSRIIARRVEPDGQKKLLLRWHPADIIPDEWVNESGYEPTKNVSIPPLHASAKSALKPVLFTQLDGQIARQKHRRKPAKLT